MMHKTKMIDNMIRSRQIMDYLAAMSWQIVVDPFESETQAVTNRVRDRHIFTH